jgi:excisionase family DNA binding protein
MTDTLTRPEDTSSVRPPSCLSYTEAVEATGVTRRHLRRLVAAGKLEAVDHGGRRWVTTSSLLAAGLTLSAPKGQINSPGPGEAGTPGQDPSASLVEEVERLRRELAVARALADERGRELDWFRDHAARLTAMLPPGPQGDQAPGPQGGPRKRWWRKAR